MTKSELRSAYPEMAEWADEIRKEFEGAKVSYLKAGDYEYGQRLDVDLAEGSNRSPT